MLGQSFVPENPLPDQPIRKRCVKLLAMQHKGENLPISGDVKSLNAMIFEIGLEKGIVVSQWRDNRLAVEVCGGVFVFKLRALREEEYFLHVNDRVGKQELLRLFRPLYGPWRAVNVASASIGSTRFLGGIFTGSTS